jgi:hypothetical protein
MGIDQIETNQEQTHQFVIKHMREQFTETKLLKILDDAATLIPVSRYRVSGMLSYTCVIRSQNLVQNTPLKSGTST